MINHDKQINDLITKNTKERMGSVIIIPAVKLKNMAAIKIQLEGGLISDSAVM